MGIYFGTRIQHVQNIKYAVTVNFFFPDFTQIVKLRRKMTFPKNGDDSSGRKRSLLAKESSSLVHIHH